MRVAAIQVNAEARRSNLKYPYDHIYQNGTSTALFSNMHVVKVVDHIVIKSWVMLDYCRSFEIIKSYETAVTFVDARECPSVKLQQQEVLSIMLLLIKSAF